MAIGKHTDFKIYEPEFYGGMYEAISQNVNGFNGASQGAIQLIAQAQKGHFEKDSFFKTIANLITRRDIDAVTGVTDLAMPQEENIAVKVNRKIGPLAHTLDSWRKLGTDAREMSFVFGKAVGDEQTKDYINTAILSVEAAIGAVAALNVDKTAASPTTLTHSYLVDGLATFGDASNNIVAWVMHSKTYFDLVKQAISDKVFEVAGATIYGASPGTFNRPVVVIDAPALNNDVTSLSTDNDYSVLGLVNGAVQIKETEGREIVSEVVTGLENLVMRVQGEYAFNVRVKGCKWDVTNGGKNPTDAALGTGSNWDKNVTSNKAFAGFRIKVK